MSIKDILSQLAPYVIAAVVAVIASVIKVVGDALIDYINKKKQETIQKVGQSTYDQNKSFAYDIWNIVEEHFRITSFIGNSIQLKIDMFNKLLLEKVPGLTQSEIDFLRQSVAGIMNEGKEKLSTDVTKEPIEVPTETVTVTPIIKYVNENGVELQPIQQPVTVETTTATTATTVNNINPAIQPTPTV